MVGLMGSLVGAVVLVALVVIGLWLTWISLRSDRHSPKPPQAAVEAEDAE